LLNEPWALSCNKQLLPALVNQSDIEPEFMSLMSMVIDFSIKHQWHLHTQQELPIA